MYAYLELTGGRGRLSLPLCLVGIDRRLANTDSACYNLCTYSYPRCEVSYRMTTTTR